MKAYKHNSFICSYLHLNWHIQICHNLFCSGKKQDIIIIHKCLQFPFHHRNTLTACNEVSANRLSRTGLIEMVL